MVIAMFISSHAFPITLGHCRADGLPLFDALADDGTHNHVRAIPRQ